MVSGYNYSLNKRFANSCIVTLFNLHIFFSPKYQAKNIEALTIAAHNNIRAFQYSILKITDYFSPQNPQYTV